MPTKQKQACPQIYGWLMAGERPQDYFAEVDTTVFHSGSRSCRFYNTEPKAKSWGTFMQQMSPKPYLEKRLRMTFWMKTQDLKQAQGWMRVDGQKGSRSLSFENMCNRPVRGDTDWTQYSIVLDVPEDSTNVAFGIMIVGTGTVWLDDFSFDVVDMSVPVTSCQCSPGGGARNLNFEEDEA